MADRQRVTINALPDWETKETNQVGITYSDLEQMQDVLKKGINLNFNDIIKIGNGTKTVGNSSKLDGATLSRFTDEVLQDDDNKIPSSKQVLKYIIENGASDDAMLKENYAPNSGEIVNRAQGLSSLDGLFGISMSEEINEESFALGNLNSFYLETVDEIGDNRNSKLFFNKNYIDFYNKASDGSYSEIWIEDGYVEIYADKIIKVYNDLAVDGKLAVSEDASILKNVLIGETLNVVGTIKQNNVQVELVSNKVTAFSTPTDEQYPSAKLTKDQLDLKEDKTNKGVAGGYAPLNGSTKIDAIYVPGAYDDYEEYDTYADLPTTGTDGILYIVLADETSGDNVSTYRWTGSVYIKLTDLLSAVEVKILYESNANTNTYTDAEKAKVLNVPTNTNTELNKKMD